MAKYGEGDKRWIVEDRPDGANVHNWHWSERNCLEWSRALLSSLLQDLTILDGEGGLVIRTKSLDKLEGEAYVNVRKGKVIPGYELSLSLSWEAHAVQNDQSTPTFRGTVEVPYLADENAGEDPEVRVTVRDDDGPAGRRVKDAFLARGKLLVLEKLRQYVKAMAAGGPAKDELEAKKVPSKTHPNSSTNVAAAAEAPARPPPPEEEKKKEGGGKKGFKTVKMRERFYCRARDLYEILMDERRWMGFTRSNARISGEVGGEFTIFDGSVTGENLELREGKLIVQRWRFTSWVDGLYSAVRLELDEPEPGVTIVNLTQTDVPEEDRYGNATVVENTERGWRDLIFNKIRAVFGFGI